SYTVIINHVAIEPTHTWSSGLLPGSTSMVPSRMRTKSGLAPQRLRTGEPQRAQKARSFPGEDSYSVRRSRPATSRKCSVRTDALVAKAVPLARRHCEQWE